MAHGRWQDLVREPAAERHLVQIYRDPAFLREAVATWAFTALRAEGGAILIGRPEALRTIADALASMGEDPAARQAEGRLVLVDAAALMARFMVDGQPRQDLLTPILAEVIAGVRAACGPTGEVRAWGEMVNILRKEDKAEAAKRLEAIWNDVIDAESIRLLCSYEHDNLAPGAHGEALRDICTGHSVLIPEEHYARFDLAVGEALVDVLGEEEAALARALLGRRRTMPIGMPPAEAVLVALHDEQPVLARAVLAAARARMGLDLVPLARA